MRVLRHPPVDHLSPAKIIEIAVRHHEEKRIVVRKNKPMNSNPHIKHSTSESFSPSLLGTSDDISGTFCVRHRSFHSTKYRRPPSPPPPWKSVALVAGSPKRRRGQRGFACIASHMARQGSKVAVILAAVGVLQQQRGVRSSSGQQDRHHHTRKRDFLSLRTALTKH